MLYRKECVEPGFVLVPRGPYLAGGDPKRPGLHSMDRLQAEYDLCMAQYPVTCGQYAEHANACIAEGMLLEKVLGLLPKPAEGVRWQVQSGKVVLPPGLDPDVPVTDITWYDARLYCIALSRRARATGRRMRYMLPTEWEWEHAAGGADGRPYPWGTAEEDTFCNGSGASSTLLPTHAWPKEDTSPYGMRGVSGGVKDFTRSLRPGVKDEVIIRGGSWKVPLFQSTTRLRAGVGKKRHTDSWGFRICYYPQE